MLKRHLIAPLTLVAVLAMAPAASALNFVEAFTAGSDTVLNDWNDGNNGWVIPYEAHPNRATTDGTSGGTGRVYNKIAGVPVTMAQQPALGLRDGTISFDLLDGTGNTDVQLVLEDNKGEEALRLFMEVKSSQLNMSAANAVDFETGESNLIAAGHPRFATISVGFDATTDMITIDGFDENGDLFLGDDVDPGPITFAMDNDVNEIMTIRWEVHADMGASDWNLRGITIDGTDAPEPASLVLLGMGSLCFLRRRRAA